MEMRSAELAAHVLHAASARRDSGSTWRPARPGAVIALKTPGAVITLKTAEGQSSTGLP